MTFKEFYEQDKIKKENEAKRIEPLKKVIREYIGNNYEELLDFIVKFDERKLMNYFKGDLNK